MFTLLNAAGFYAELEFIQEAINICYVSKDFSHVGMSIYFETISV